MKLQNEAWRRRKRRSGEEVKRLVDEFEASGSDRAEFCRGRGLALFGLRNQAQRAWRVADDRVAQEQDAAHFA